MPDAFFIAVGITLIYGIVIAVVTASVSAKGGRTARIACMNLAALYFICLIVVSFFPTALSDGINIFVPLSGFISAATGGWLSALNYVSRMLLAAVTYLPFGAVTAVAVLLGAGARPLAAGVCAAFIFAFITEAVQIFIPYRAASADELIFETLGAAGGALAVTLNRGRESVKKFISSLL